jgi:hypothetical protein
MGAQPLRGIGPRTFISYSFRDTATAIVLETFLVNSGFQVTMEDERSLLNNRLADALERRVQDAECFVQLRTAAANASHWVNEEFKMADQRRRKDDCFMLLPIVFDVTGLPEDVRNLVYIAAPQGLTEDVLRVTRDKALEIVRPIRVNHIDPTRLEDEDVAAAIRYGGPNTRIILDSQGYWPDKIEELIGWIIAKPDSPHKQTFVEQEQFRKQDLDWLYARADVAAKLLINKLNESLAAGTIEIDIVHRIVTSVYRILFVQRLWRVLENTRLAGLLKVNAAQIEGLEQLQKLETLGRYSPDRPGAEMSWALAPIMEKTTYDVASLIRIGFDAQPEKYDAYLYFPRCVIGRDWMNVLWERPSPRSLIPAWTWCVIGFPQIAAYAMLTVGRYNPQVAAETFRSMEAGAGWELSDYTNIGPP